MTDNVLDRIVNVKNRGTSEAGYTLPDSGIRRNWTPGEIKKNIPVSELEQATYIPGGFKLIQKYLLINDKEVCDYLGLETEPEYFYDEAEIKTLLSSGTIDQFLDCLDFAPGGVLDLIKKIAVEINLNDINKRQAIKDKLEFDVTAAIANAQYANSTDEEAETNKKRRAKPMDEKATPTTRGRRTKTTETPKYTRVEE